MCSQAANRPVEIKFERYIVQGTVVDEAGTSRSTARRSNVGGSTLFTDSRGRFFVRVSSNRTTAFRVLVDDFLATGRFEVVVGSGDGEAASRAREHAAQDRRPTHSAGSSVYRARCSWPRAGRRSLTISDCAGAPRAAYLVRIDPQHRREAPHREFITTADRQPVLERNRQRGAATACSIRLGNRSDRAFACLTRASVDRHDARVSDNRSNSPWRFLTQHESRFRGPRAVQAAPRYARSDDWPDPPSSRSRSC